MHGTDKTLLKINVILSPKAFVVAAVYVKSADYRPVVVRIIGLLAQVGVADHICDIIIPNHNVDVKIRFN